MKYNTVRYLLRNRWKRKNGQTDRLSYLTEQPTDLLQKHCFPNGTQVWFLQPNQLKESQTRNTVTEWILRPGKEICNFHQKNSNFPNLDFWTPSVSSSSELWGSARVVKTPRELWRERPVMEGKHRALHWCSLEPSEQGGLWTQTETTHFHPQI